jgi:hypothetical protein
MNMLLSILTGTIFAAASFSAVAQDSETALEKTTAKNKITGLQTNKDTSAHQTTSTKLDKNHKAAQRSGKSAARYRRPMFK